MNLILRGRRPVEQRESYVREDAGVLLPSGEIRAPHVTEIRGRAAERDPVAFVVRAHTHETVATGNLAFEMEDVGGFRSRHRGLVLTSIFVKPGDGKRTAAAVVGAGGNRRRAVLRQAPLRPDRRQHRGADKSCAKTKESAAVHRLQTTVMLNALHEARSFRVPKADLARQSL